MFVHLQSLIETLTKRIPKNEGSSCCFCITRFGKFKIKKKSLTLFSNINKTYFFCITGFSWLHSQDQGWFGKVSWRVCDQVVSSRWASREIQDMDIPWWWRNQVLHQLRHAKNGLVWWGRGLGSRSFGRSALTRWWCCQIQARHWKVFWRKDRHRYLLHLGLQRFQLFQGTQSFIHPKERWIKTHTWYLTVISLKNHNNKK